MYKAVRQASFSNCKDEAFFVHSRRRRYANNTLQKAFADLAFRAGLRGSKAEAQLFMTSVTASRSSTW